MALRPGAAFATAAIVGAVALGGTTWAYAQEDSTTTTTPSTTDDTTADDGTTDDGTTTRDHNCPERDSTTDSEAEAEGSVAS